MNLMLSGIGTSIGTCRVQVTVFNHGSNVARALWLMLWLRLLAEAVSACDLSRCTHRHKCLIFAVPKLSGVIQTECEYATIICAGERSA
jgi:hypothetical protein